MREADSNDAPTVTETRQAPSPSDRVLRGLATVAHLATCIGGWWLLGFGFEDRNLRRPMDVKLLVGEVSMRPVILTALAMPVVIFGSVGLLAWFDSRERGRRPSGLVPALVALLALPFAAATLFFVLSAATEWGTQPGRTVYQDLRPNGVLAFPTAVPILIYCTHACLARWNPRSKSFNRTLRWRRLFLVGAVPGVVLCGYAFVVLFAAT